MVPSLLQQSNSSVQSCCIEYIIVMKNSYLDRKFKEQQTKNPLVKCGFKCCHCCLACLEKCMKYLSRNAYILVITRGTNFFKSSVNSFGLLASNLATVSVLKSVSTLFIWMGKMSNIIMYLSFIDDHL